MSKIKHIASLVLLLASSSFAGARDILGIPGEEATSVGIYIAELNSGKILMDNNSDVALTPASVMKAITTATTLSVLGTEYRFRTNVYTTGRMADGVLHGNVLIKGGGDPTLESRHFPDNNGFVDSIVCRLTQAGVREITGNIVVEQTGMTDQGIMPKWEIEDVAWDYGAGLYALNYMDNSFSLSLPSRISVPDIPGLVVNDCTSFGDNDPVLVRGVNSDVLNIFGSIPDRKGYKIQCSMPDPSRVLVNDLKRRLLLNGIAVSGSVGERGDTVLIYFHNSPKSKDIMASLMVRSDNLMAEGMLRASAPDSCRSGAVAAEKDYWKGLGIDCDCITVHDGSGLARSNKLSPRFIGNILTAMAKGDKADDYISLFPRAGKNGTLRNLLKGSRLSGLLAMKSGSMSGVQCYAGYKLDAADRPTHVVVIMTNSFFCKRRELINGIERLLLRIF